MTENGPATYYYFGSMVMYGRGAYAQDRNTCVRTLAENTGGGGLYVNTMVFLSLTYTYVQ